MPLLHASAATRAAATRTAPDETARRRSPRGRPGLAARRSHRGSRRGTSRRGPTGRRSPGRTLRRASAGPARPRRAAARPRRSSRRACAGAASARRPISVPPVPRPATNASISGQSARISGRRRLLVGARVGRVAVLVRHDEARVARHELLGERDRAVGAQRTRRVDDLRAEERGIWRRSLRDVVGHDHRDPVALAPPDHRQRDAGVAGRRLEDDRVRVRAGRQPRGPRSRSSGDPVLDRPRRVQASRAWRQIRTLGVRATSAGSRRSACGRSRRRCPRSRHAAPAPRERGSGGRRSRHRRRRRRRRRRPRLRQCHRGDLARPSAAARHRRQEDHRVAASTGVAQLRSR